MNTPTEWTTALPELNEKLDCLNAFDTDLIGGKMASNDELTAFFLEDDFEFNPLSLADVERFECGSVSKVSADLPSNDVSPFRFSGNHCDSHATSSFGLGVATTKRGSHMISSGSEDLSSNKHTPAKKQKQIKRDTTEGWPNRPLSPYNIFFKAERAKLILEQKMNSIVKQNGKSGVISSNLIRKAVALKWKSMSADDKVVYNKVAAESMKSYRGQVKMFLKTGAWEGTKKSSPFPAAA